MQQKKTVRVKEIVTYRYLAKRKALGQHFSWVFNVVHMPSYKNKYAAQMDSLNVIFEFMTLNFQ